MQVGKINLSIESDYKHIALLGKAINSLCSLANLSDIDTYQVELCVVEAVNNAIEHAYERAKGKLVEVTFSLYQSKVAIDICDTGKGMDEKWLMRDKICPDFDVHDLSSLPEGGWGLSIMHQVMDEVTYRTSNGKNVLTLTKRFTSDNRTAAENDAFTSA